MTLSTSRFAHHRLHCYHAALELLVGVERLAARLPRGHADLRDQMRRAAGAVVRHVAEGANRMHPRDKAARFAVAKGEAGECDAALEVLGALGLASSQAIGPLRVLTDRVAAMLTGLARRETRAAEPGA